MTKARGWLGLALGTSLASIVAPGLAVGQTVTEDEFGGGRTRGPPCFSQRYPDIERAAASSFLLWREYRGFDFSEIRLARLGGQGDLVEKPMTVGTTFVAEPKMAMNANRILVAMLDRGLRIRVLEPTGGGYRTIRTSLLAGDGVPSAGVVGPIVGVGARNRGFVVVFPRKGQLEAWRLDGNGVPLGEPQAIPGTPIPFLTSISDVTFLIYVSSRGMEVWKSVGDGAFEQREPLPIAPWNLQLTTRGSTVGLYWGERSDASTLIYHQQLSIDGEPLEAQPILLERVRARLTEMSVTSDGELMAWVGERLDRTRFTSIMRIQEDGLVRLHEEEGYRFDLAFGPLSHDSWLLASTVYVSLLGYHLHRHVVGPDGVTGGAVYTDPACRFEPRFAVQDERVVATWIDARAGAPEIYGQEMTLSGVPLRDEVRFSSSAPSRFHAAVAGRDWWGDVGWAEIGQRLDFLRLQGRGGLIHSISLSEGIYAFGTGPSSSPGGSHILVAWLGTEGGGRPVDVMGSLLDRRGHLVRTTQIGTLGRVGGFSVNSSPVVGWDGSRWLVLWTNRIEEGQLDSVGIHGAFVDPSGDVTRLGLLVACEGLRGLIRVSSSPVGSVVAWQRATADGRWALVAQRLNNQAVPVGEPQTLTEHVRTFDLISSIEGIDIVWPIVHGVQGLQLTGDGDILQRWTVGVDGSFESLALLRRDGPTLLAGAARTTGAPGRDVSLRLLRFDIRHGEVPDAMGRPTMLGAETNDCSCRSIPIVDRRRSPIGLLPALLLVGLLVFATRLEVEE